MISVKMQIVERAGAGSRLARSAINIPSLSCTAFGFWDILPVRRDARSRSRSNTTRSGKVAKVKSTLKAIIRYATFHAPWGVREAVMRACLDRDESVLDVCLDRLSFAQRYSRLLPKCKLVEIAAEGDRGIVTSASNDVWVLSEYASTG